LRMKGHRGQEEDRGARREERRKERRRRGGGPLDAGRGIWVHGCSGQRVNAGGTGSTASGEGPPAAEVADLLGHWQRCL